MQVEWWYWTIAGFCLIGLELIFPSFTITWFGVGALAVGVVKFIWPQLPTVAQIVMWPIASICFTVMWFKYLKPKGGKGKSGRGENGIVGETGTVIRYADAGCGRWTVRFPVPLLGADEWCCYSDEELQVGDSVRVTEIDGQVLKVAKFK